MTMERIETLFYRVGERVDELKPHFKPETNLPCDGRSGIVIATENKGRKASIECDSCHGTVKEEV